MADLPVSALGPREQKQVENARIAVELGNFEYAIEACTDVLKRFPGCASVRRLQWSALLKRTGSNNGLIGKVRGLVILIAGLPAVKGSPEQLLELASTILVEDPRNVRALTWLAVAAGDLGLVETAVFAHEAVRELRPTDVDNTLALGFALLDANRVADALRIADDVLRIRPVDAAAQDLMRRASVLQAERDRQWAVGAAVQPMKRKPEATGDSLPTAEVVTTGDWTQRLIDDALARLGDEQDNLAHYVSLVNGYRRLGRWDQALDWIHQARARKVTGADVALEEHEAELRGLLFEQRFREAELALARSRDDAELQARCTAARAEWLAFRISEAKRQLQRDPADAGARHALGALYLDSGDADQAIAEFSQHVTHPRLRIAALVGLGRALKRKRLFAEAIEHFMTAKRELAVMDDVKKEVIYELGGCLLLKGEIDAAMEEFKSIHGEGQSIEHGKLASPQSVS